MAEDYPLEQLSARAFEQLTVALSILTLGPGVSAFGAGADGGREATYEGPVNWSSTTGFGEESWDGYIVIQAKQKAFPDADPARNASWLRGQIKTELDSWEHPDSRRLRFPKYIVFVTNVRLSSTAQSGGIDSLNEYIAKRSKEKLFKLGLRGWKIWHRDQLNGLLSVHEGLRNAFPAMLTAGDIVARLGALGSHLPHSDRIREVLIEHAQFSLLNEQWVNFSEAGGDSRDSIDKTIIDLPVSKDGINQGFALKTIIRQGERVLRRSLTANDSQRHIVLTGAPGNGKSTLSRFIAQVYRTNFVLMSPLIPSAQETVDGTANAGRRLSLDTPKNVRWPFRVDLAEYADGLGPNGDKSLLRWICEKITRRSTVDITPTVLHSWLRVWPWLLVLDGLDEVTQPEVRTRILDEIRLFVELADQIDADLLVVVTTRPTGYTERVAPQYFHQIDLGYLERSKALEYGNRAIERRLSGDLDRQEGVTRSFGKAVRDPNAERLLKTPLQVLMLTYILEKLGTLPADRYELFWRYYTTVYDREAAKLTSLASLFSNHRADITDLHERVALELQIQAETMGEATSHLPLTTLRQMAVNRMSDIGHDSPGSAERIADQIVQAATHRLVLFVPESDDTIAFEVRSLQELMAARAISDGEDSEVERRLLITAPSPHWRNTWVFVAGRIFSEGYDHQRNRISDIVSRVDDLGPLPSWLCPVAPELAAEILDDGLSATKPRWQRRFVDLALKSLSGTIPRNVRGMEIGLAAAADNPSIKTHIRNSFRQALVSAPKQIAVACLIMAEGNLGGAAPVDPEERPDYVSLLAGTGHLKSGPIVTLGALLEAGICDFGESRDARELVLASLAELRQISFVDTGNDGLALLQYDMDFAPDRTVAAFENDESRMVFELLCGNLDPTHWLAQAVLARLLWPIFTRIPVGEEIRESFNRKA
ncbi:NACHT domain-containing protein [Paeniglutamicibacter sp.]|uniref:NACHT domain-containing protein n=1 Tax=Paeniglutamicibacter sp. TaxID=1934391 RepID=UPI00398926F0